MTNFPPTLTINVTQADIEHGKPQSCPYCPISLAVAPLFPLFNVRTHQSSIHVFKKFEDIYLGERVAMYMLPIEAVDFIHKFDKFQPTKPFTFIATLCTP